jgi:acyl-CoA synthetase (AMP-forming)/AMP-acid ligase II
MDIGFIMNNITEILDRNAREWPDDVALVEINPQELERHNTTWREYSLIEASASEAFRDEITWAQFKDRADRFANLLVASGYGRGDKVAILLMNCLEWLPIYFGVLKAGCMAVPLNFRYTADEIKYCLELADAQALVFGPEFTGRVEQIVDRIPKVRTTMYVGDDCPSFALPYIAEGRFAATISATARADRGTAIPFAPILIYPRCAARRLSPRSRWTAPPSAHLASAPALARAM